MGGDWVRLEGFTSNDCEEEGVGARRDKMTRRIVRGGGGVPVED